MVQERGVLTFTTRKLLRPNRLDGSEELGWVAIEDTG